MSTQATRKERLWKNSTTHVSQANVAHSWTINMNEIHCEYTEAGFCLH